MNFWNYNLFCYLCMHVYDNECKDLFLTTNLTVGFMFSNITQFENINNCYLEDFKLIPKNDSQENVIEYNFLSDVEKIEDYIEKEISLEEKFSFYINYNNIEIKNKFNEIDKENIKAIKDYDFIAFNKKSLFKLLPNLYQTTRNISTIFFDLYINESIGFFTSEGKPKLSYYWLKDFLFI